jgi:hypothetical protein
MSSAFLAGNIQSMPSSELRTSLESTSTSWWNIGFRRDNHLPAERKSKYGEEGYGGRGGLTGGRYKSTSDYLVDIGHRHFRS